MLSDATVASPLRTPASQLSDQAKPPKALSNNGQQKAEIKKYAFSAEAVRVAVSVVNDKNTNDTLETRNPPAPDERPQTGSAFDIPGLSQRFMRIRELLTEEITFLENNDPVAPVALSKDETEDVLKRLAEAGSSPSFGEDGIYVGMLDGLAYTFTKGGGATVHDPRYATSEENGQMRLEHAHQSLADVNRFFAAEADYRANEAKALSGARIDKSA
ncbi:hypothetical protein JM93_00942 [Roseibium hamelinense]|uniref:Uncharacterized protein n=1 Tax=Roseibium hamelinense TaxID=150831 RepID=A0A562TJS6_9HYPH|nr:hypothetical protein [Roseibium hamelinense]MTI42740.1 hypothetical protein [Roseibium hamelinense]TWI93386.1 hypothetical protein JM93_00942 [Roseibium hamelinense]